MAAEHELDKIRQSALDLSDRQREISVAEFFEKNRHLLGFDNKRKALLTAVKEAVDNSLDACEEAHILPEIHVEIIEMAEERFRVIIEDNGPGITRKQIPNIFARLLYGSKFHTLKQQRGQQGIGISAAVMYAQLTTGRPARITSKIAREPQAHYIELKINTQSNMPVIEKEEMRDWAKEHGTRIEIDLEGTYIKGNQSVDEYLKETAIVNPHITIIYTNPKAEQLIFPRATDQLPKLPQEILPHPYGIELGLMLKMLGWTEAKTVSSFLQTEFSRVGAGTAKEILEKAAILASLKPKEVSLQQAEKLIKAIRETKIMAPPTDCISPVGAELLEKGLRKEVPAEFFTSVTRPPEVYRGNPFVIEVVLAYGGELPKDKTATLMRFANRVPLLYQQGSCASNKSLTGLNWKAYGLQQQSGSLPVGPLVIIVHLVSVWPPFTSEAKEAIAHYPEIIKEIKLALQECGRQLGTYLRKKGRVREQIERVQIFERYIPEVASSLAKLSGNSEGLIKDHLVKMLEKNKEFIIKNQPIIEKGKKEYGLELGADEDEDEELAQEGSDE